MGRSAADTKFGFKAKGLVRILLAADIDEVQKALDVLSFTTPTSGVGEALKNMIKAPFELLEGLLDLVFEEVSPLAADLSRQIRVLDDAIALLVDSASHLESAGHHRDAQLKVVSNLRSLRGQLARQIISREALHHAALQVKEKSETLEETQETSLNEILDNTTFAA